MLPAFVLRQSFNHSGGSRIFSRGVPLKWMRTILSHAHFFRWPRPPTIENDISKEWKHMYMYFTFTEECFGSWMLFSKYWNECTCYIGSYTDVKKLELTLVGEVVHFNSVGGVFWIISSHTHSLLSDHHQAWCRSQPEREHKWECFLNVWIKLPHMDHGVCKWITRLWSCSALLPVQVYLLVIVTALNLCALVLSPGHLCTAFQCCTL